ncbi:MAG: hypothetical protein ACE5G0_08045 [Rhodothermales bacterium]
MIGLFAAETAWAQGGHGPVFGLATPTLPQGAWNVDLTTMSVARGGRAAMVRGTLRYGLTPDVQLNLSLPAMLETISTPPNTRIGTMMGGMGDLEALVLWRFHKQYPGVGRRFESTLLVSGLYSVQDERRGVKVGPGFHAAAVTGYASRTVYAWGGGGYQRYFEKEGDRLGDLVFVSAVVAWRPPVFQGDYPKPDWRIFAESLAEFVGRDQVRGQSVTSSGGEKIFVGPTFLGLYRAWGLGAGVLFPVYQNLNGMQEKEEARLAINLSYWF